MPIKLKYLSNEKAIQKLKESKYSDAKTHMHAHNGMWQSRHLIILMQYLNYVQLSLWTASVPVRIT